MRWLLAIAILLTSLPASAWYSDTSFQYRQKITVDNTKVGADLTDFPIYLNTDDLAAGFYSHAKSDCADVRITKSDGSTEVPREIVFCSGSNGEIHFKAAGTLSGSVNTDFYIYYGNASASDYATSATYGAENVWDSNFEAVYHLQEDPSGTAPQLLDSTSNSFDLTTAGTMTSGDSVAAKLTNGVDFDGSNDDARSGSNSNIDGDEARTLSCWVKLTATPADADPIVSIGTSTAGTSWNIVTGLGGDAEWGIRTGTSVGSSSDLNTATSSTSDVGTFVYMAAKHDGTNVFLRRNTTEIGTGARTFVTGAGIIRIAEGPQATRNPPATIDEVRLSTTDRSDEWLDAEYNNQSSSSTFYTASAEEEAPVTPGRILFLWNTF